MLGCVVLAALVLALWWTKRLHHEEQGQVFAADVERGGPRCSLGASCGRLLGTHGLQPAQHAAALPYLPSPFC